MTTTTTRSQPRTGAAHRTGGAHRAVAHRAGAVHRAAGPVRRPGRPRRRATLVAWTLALGLPAAAAAALWTVGGSGPGQATAISAQNLVVTAGTASAQLYPGATGDIVYAVSNPNPFPVRVDGVVLGAVTGPGGCDGTNFTTAAGTVAPVTIAANASGTVTVVGGVSMVVGAGDDCQGVTVTVAGTMDADQV